MDLRRIRAGLRRSHVEEALMPDGIKFLIELDSKTKGASDAIRGLGGVGSAAEKANEHIKGMGESGKGLSRDVFSAEFAVHALEHAWEGAKWAAEKVRDIVKETITTVAGAERSKMALTNLMGSEGAASAEIKYLEKFSQLTEFSKHESEGFGIQLMKAGYKGQDFADALAAVADAASLSADKTAGAESAMESLSRMKLTGKLDARSLKGLGLDARDVMKDLGGALGMTPQSVKKLLEQGAVPAAAAYGAVLRAIERKTGKELGAAGLAAGGTLSAKLTHLGELPGRIMARLEGSPAMERIKDRFDKMLGALDPDTPKGQKIIGGLEKLMAAISDVDLDPLFATLTKLPGTLARSIGPIAELAEKMVRLANAVASLPGRGQETGEAWGKQELEDQQAQFRYQMDEWNKTHKTKSAMLETNPLAPGYGVLEDKPATSWSMLPSGRPLPNLAGAAATPTVVAPLTVNNTINVAGTNATKEEIHEAAKSGTEAAAKEREKTAIRAGVRAPQSQVGR
jgi:tape measure domain-containing protein